MEDRVKPSRRYRSALRTEQAEATRERIIESARELFLRHGYSGTTIRAVATDAGVAEMTVYATVGDKRGLLQAVISKAIGGPDYQPDPARFAAIGELSTPRERLRAWAALTAEIVARTSPVHAVIREAAAKEPSAEELRTTLDDTRLDRQREALHTYLRGSLRHGLTERDAAEQHFALSSPELHHLVTAQLGWDERRYARWLAETLERELLAPDAE